MQKRLFIAFSIVMLGSLISLTHAQFGVYRTACKNNDQAVLRQLPAHLCDCVEAGKISYGVDTTITGDTWLNAPLPMLEKGMTVYWVGSGNMKMEVYLSCTYKVPVISFTLQKRGSYIYSEKDLISKFDSIGKVAKVNWRDTTLFGCPHLHLQPEGNATGRFYYNKEMVGPHSTCNEDLWPLGIPMQYVISDPDDIYELEPSTWRKKPFIVWEPKNKADSLTSMVTLTLLDACQNGQVIAQKTIHAAPYVWVLDSTLMSSYYNRASLFLKVNAKDTGLVTMRNTMSYTYDTISCILDETHRKIKVGDHWVNHEGLFTDTTWISGNTLHVRNYIVSFTNETSDNFSIWSTLLTNCTGANRVGEPIHLSASGKIALEAYDQQGAMVTEQPFDYEHTIRFGNAGIYTLKLVSTTGTKTNIKIKINN